MVSFYWTRLTQWLSQILVDDSDFDNTAENPEDSGQGLVEYALLLIFVGVALIAMLTILSPGIANIYSRIVASL